MLLWCRTTLPVLISLDMTIFFSNAFLKTRQYATLYEPFPGEIPFLLTLLSKTDDDFYCTAVLITRWHSITSCSCLTYPTIASRQNRLEWDNFLLVAGVTVYSKIRKRDQKRQIKFLIVHPGCEKHGIFIKYDVGIAVSKKPFNLGKFVHTVKLPFRHEASKPPRFKKMLFSNYSMYRKQYLGASLAYWSREGKLRRLKILRMDVDESHETGYSRIHKEVRDKDLTRYTIVKFKAKFCPTFDEAALLSDDLIFFGIVFGSKDLICEHQSILFTRIDYVLEWIVHVISKGRTVELKVSLIIVLIFSCFRLVTLI